MEYLLNQVFELLKICMGVTTVHRKFKNERLVTAYRMFWSSIVTCHENCVFLWLKEGRYKFGTQILETVI